MCFDDTPSDVATDDPKVTVFSNVTLRHRVPPAP
jgi:hypothetical protein